MGAILGFPDLRSPVCESLFGGPELEVCWFGLRIRNCLLDEARRLDRPAVCAQVGEWLKPTDCKSVPPSEVRRFESFPVHQNVLYLVDLYKIGLHQEL